MLDIRDIVEPFCSFLLRSTPPSDKIVNFFWLFSSDSAFNAYDKAASLSFGLDNLPRKA